MTKLNNKFDLNDFTWGCYFNDLTKEYSIDERLKSISNSIVNRFDKEKLCNTYLKYHNRPNKYCIDHKAISQDVYVLDKCKFSIDNIYKLNLLSFDVLDRIFINNILDNNKDLGSVLHNFIIETMHLILSYGIEDALIYYNNKLEN